MAHSETDVELELENETRSELSDEEESLLYALDEVEQTMDAMSAVLASLRERLEAHMKGRSMGTTAVLEEWPDDSDSHLH